MGELDLIDRKILAELMRDATIPIARLADRVGLSQTPCWKRIQKLEALGVMTGRVAVVDPARLGLALSAFVAVEAAEHGAEWRVGFAAAVAAFPEIVEAHRMAGDPDYLLKVVLPDMAAYDDFYRRFTGVVPLRNVTTSFVLERMKSAPYPLDTVNR